MRYEAQGALQEVCSPAMHGVVPVPSVPLPDDMDEVDELSLQKAVLAAESKAWRLLAKVPDPEIPVLNVIDLGIIRSVQARAQDHVAIAVTPTYAECRATEIIHKTIVAKLKRGGFTQVEVTTVLTPRWTSDWLTDAGREKLRAHGIASPSESLSKLAHLFRAPSVRCVRCSSLRTQHLSEITSTPCKALYRCCDCQHRFEYFKCI